MDTEVLQPLQAIESSLGSLVSSLTATNSFAAAPQAARDLVAADDALDSALLLLKQHQDNHARILTLRVEADRLHNQLKSIIRTCVDLRSEVRDIDPSILDEGDEDGDDTGPSTQPAAKARNVDYGTLLGFAARIGKHNATAARQAEEALERRRAEAGKTKTLLTNGDSMSAVEENSGSNTNEMANQRNTQQSQAELAQIDQSLAMQRAAMGMAFPAPDVLRMGVLGQLQLLREQQGEEAVEQELERLVAQSELSIDRARTDDMPPVISSVKKESERAEEKPISSTGAAPMALPRPDIATTHALPPKPPAPSPVVKERAKVKLDDFGASDSE